MRAICFFLICFGLAACGTKPKDLKGEEPFPAQYPQGEQQPAPPITNPSLQSPVPANPAGK